jgi:hypothetical protein
MAPAARQHGPVLTHQQMHAERLPSHPLRVLVSCNVCNVDRQTGCEQWQVFVIAKDSIPLGHHGRGTAALGTRPCTA